MFRRTWAKLFAGAVASALAFTDLLAAPAPAPAPAPTPAPAPAPALAPSLMLANTWRAGLPIADYWVSEKFDGVRGYWDGAALWTRRGHRVAAPAWFTQGWPKEPMDGELWAGRGRFEQAQSTVAVEVPDNEAWRRMRFMVFDLPARKEDFDHRKGALKSLVQDAAVPWLVAVDQVKVASRAELQEKLDRVVADGGEGVMLHRGASLYRGERSDDLVKLKPYDDAEATVVAVVPGKGKYSGMMGALLVSTAEGVRFRLGSGFTDAHRSDPPAVGSVVTYRFRGRNASGIPRFATFMRVRLL